MRWRVVPIQVGDIYFQMGMDEAIMESVGEGDSPPTLRFWRIDGEAASIGVHQKVEEELRLDFCKTNNIAVSRRISGGGSVYKEGNTELNYSLIIPANHSILPSDLMDSHKVLCKGLVIGLRRMGIDAELVPINDVVVGGKKVSGNAQARKKKAVLNHGTMLLDVDPLRMFTVLKVPEVPFYSEGIEERAKRLSDRVTSLKSALGRDVGFQEVVENLLKGFSEALAVSFVEEGPTCAELHRTRELSESKYSTQEWNFKR